MTREEAIEILKDLWRTKYSTYLEADIRKALDMAIEALSQEPCEDAISRQAVIDALTKTSGIRGDALKALYDLPSVKQEPKTGHWDWVQYDSNPNIGNWHCSECRSIVIGCVNKEDKGGIPFYKYCPHCGAMMVEPQERSDKE